MARKRNPRRLALEELRYLKRELGSLVAQLDIDGNVCEITKDENGRLTGAWRQRRPEEYPENYRKQWEDMEHRLCLLEQRITNLRAYAQVQASQAPYA